MFAKRREQAGINEALTILRDITWRSRACAQWVRDNVFVALKTGALSVKDADEISDHAEEADHSLQEACMILHPELGTDDRGNFEVAMFRRVPRLEQPTPDDILAQVQGMFSEVLEHARETAPYGVAILASPHSRFSVEDIEGLSGAFADAAQAIQAGLHALDLSVSAPKSGSGPIPTSASHARVRSS